VRLFALCWIGVVMVFFTFSTTQEYYSMPIYPAVALLLGCALAAEERGIATWVRRGTRVLATIAGLAAIVVITILALVRNLPAPGYIAGALSAHPNAYRLSLGHM
jgi:4-amino-4-deoxy-L-arabinose transferase-like glycosyltransferase